MDIKPNPAANSEIRHKSGERRDYDELLFNIFDMAEDEVAEDAGGEAHARALAAAHDHLLIRPPR